MKHSAKIMGLILAACLCAALTGCGREEDAATTETAVETEKETTKQTEDEGLVNDVTNGTDTADTDRIDDTENGADEIGEGISEVGEGIADGAEDLVDGATDDTTADSTADNAANNP